MNAMRCDECGAEAPSESTFCPKCGARLDAASAPSGDVANGRDRFADAARPRGDMPAEDELWSGGYSAKAMAGTFMMTGVLTVVAAVVAAFAGPAAWTAWIIGVVLAWGGLGLVYLYRRMTVHYRLTTFRFFHEVGLLNRTGDRVEVIDIDDVTLRQGPIERIFGVGMVRIESSDKTHPELHLPGIDDAKRVADLIDGTRRAERHRRGMFMENV
jgi:membrane protein YdbS with pleckstrin-like domain